LTSKAQHEVWMQRALECAREGMGLTRPNPPVGAVCVARGKLAGEGTHRRAGGPHAEIHALRQAGTRARGSTLYVTLEPCSTRGRTPPCTEAILASGVREVVVGSTDPNPAHRGRGLRLLRAAGVKVTSGMCRADCDALLEPFRLWVTGGTPFVTLKLATTLDGRIADRHGASRWITGSEARREVQALRRCADAILVGRNTLELDDPSLLPRPAYGRKPYRVILSASGRVPLAARVFNDTHAERTFLLTTKACPAKVLTRLKRQGVCILILPARRGRIPVDTALKALGKQGILHVLCEGGGDVAADLLHAGAVNELRLFTAASFLGGDGVCAVGGRGWTMADRPEWKLVSVDQLGEDACMVARPKNLSRRG